MFFTSVATIATDVKNNSIFLKTTMSVSLSALSQSFIASTLTAPLAQFSSNLPLLNSLILSYTMIYLKLQKEREWGRERERKKGAIYLKKHSRWKRLPYSWTQKSFISGTIFEIGYSNAAFNWNPETLHQLNRHNNSHFSCNRWSLFRMVGSEVKNPSKKIIWYSISLLYFFLYWFLSNGESSFSGEKKKMVKKETRQGLTNRKAENFREFWGIIFIQWF